MVSLPFQTPAVDPTLPESLSGSITREGGRAAPLADGLSWVLSGSVLTKSPPDSPWAPFLSREKPGALSGV